MAKSKYIQLNLQTKEHDFREYLDRRSVEASVEVGVRVSVTKYIQNLILDDMEKDATRNADKNKLKAELKESIDNMGIKELELLSYLIDKIQK